MVLGDNQKIDLQNIILNVNVLIKCLGFIEYFLF